MIEASEKSVLGCALQTRALFFFKSLRARNDSAQTQSHGRDTLALRHLPKKKLFPIQGVGWLVRRRRNHFFFRRFKVSARFLRQQGRRSAELPVLRQLVSSPRRAMTETLGLKI